MEDLDALVRRVDPDRWLSSRFIADHEARSNVIALYAFEHELSRIPQAVTEPLMGEIRLTWWAEAVAEIFEGRAVRRHPVTLALAQAAKRGLPREPLDTMIEARFAGRADAAAVMAAAAALLGSPKAQVEAAARGDLAQANRDLRDLPAAAFPAVAHATLARAKAPSAMEKRLRLTWAVVMGRL